ncbi:MAG: hypothetical protein U0W24_17315 [Bacteroidales bacterium]
MLQNFEIFPGRGIGNILLGMNRQEVENILGQPDDKEEIEYDDGESSCTYYYFDLKIDLTFESEDNDRLSFISIENSHFKLKNKIKIGETKDNVIKYCKELNFSLPEEEDMSNEDVPDQILLALENENINFWFTDNLLDEIQIGPFWKDDDTPIWPE